jgi:diadenosine tetraphosphate (Ap4A) HIT family hydrolase
MAPDPETPAGAGTPAAGDAAPRGRPMDRVWAGWRSAYVAAAGNGALVGEGSIFRRILDSGLPDEETHVVWRGDEVFAILNAFPYTSGHLLVMPYREVPELEDLTPSESAELWEATRAAVAAVRTAYAPQGVNVGINLGEAAGAGVPSHVHVHVLPRWNADSNFMTAVAETRVLPESLGDSWAKLRAAWPGAGS